MQALSLDYDDLMASIQDSRTPAGIGTVLIDAAADRYEAQMDGTCQLVTFTQMGAVYWFDLGDSVGLPQAARTIAAWALTPAAVRRRDKSYQRGFPMTPDAAAPADRGHLIPHLSGGEFGPNIFRQDRRLNQGRSEEGKRYRAREREAAASVGALYFGHLLYNDLSDYPVRVETALLLPGASLQVDQFENKPEQKAGPSSS